MWSLSLRSFPLLDNFVQTEHHTISTSGNSLFRDVIAHVVAFGLGQDVGESLQAHIGTSSSSALIQSKP